MSDPEARFPLPARRVDGACLQVPAGNAFAWLEQGWAQFVGAPGPWVGMTLITLALVGSLAAIPGLGLPTGGALLPLLVAGALSFCRRQSDAADRRAPRVRELFAGLRTAPRPLLALGALTGLGVLLIVHGAVNVLGTGIGVSPARLLLALLFTLIALVPLAMALWFAPALVQFQGLSPLAALRASFRACARNLRPLSVFVGVVSLIGFFAVLPVGLGLLILLPVVAGSLFASYRDIFVAA